MVSLNDYLAQFFEKHKEFLTNQYPGLKLSRLQSETQVYLKNMSGGIDHSLKDVYFENSIDQKSLGIQLFLKKIMEGVPLEYISGTCFFYNCELSVNENVLIPRSETEIMVEKTLEEIQKYKNKGFDHLKVLDLGTGSGAIILSLLQESLLNITGTASDICAASLEVAKLNYFNLGYRIPEQSTLTFLKSDLFKNIDSKFDIIITNPPYIKNTRDKSQVHSQVDKFEPHVALYLDDAVYSDWFNQLFKSSYDSLYENGLFIMEGHEDHLQELAKELGRLNFKDIEVIKDYTQRDRFLKGYR